MFKLYLATLLALSSLSFSEENTTTYINQGNSNLLLGLPQEALKDFEKAQEGETSRFEKFLIAYGKIIAYDQLGHREECERIIGVLCLESSSQINDDFLQNSSFTHPSSSSSDSHSYFINSDSSSSSSDSGSSYINSYSYFSDSNSSSSSSYFPFEVSEEDTTAENHSNMAVEKFLEEAPVLFKTAPSLDVQKLLFLLMYSISDFADDIS